MKIKLLLLLLVVSCATVKLSGRPDGLEIHEIQSIVELEQWVVPDTLVLFDLDNTVFEVTDPVGNALFYNYLMKAHSGEEYKALPRIWAVLQKSDVRPVESRTVETIQKLQDRGVRLMAFTARDLTVLDATLRQVKSLGIDFSRTALKRHSKYVHEGILFATMRTSKGDALKAYLDGADFQPKRIVLIDDLEKNLVSVCKITGAIGLYYPVIEKRGEWDEKEAKRRWLSQ